MPSYIFGGTNYLHGGMGSFHPFPAAVHPRVAAGAVTPPQSSAPVSHPSRPDIPSYVAPVLHSPVPSQSAGGQGDLYGHILNGFGPRGYA